MSNLLKRRLTLVLLSSALAVVGSGCNPVAWWANMRAPEVYVKSDSVVELRGPAKVKVWAHDSKGNVIRGYVNAQDRWLIGPAAAAPAVNKPAEGVEPTTDDRKWAEVAEGVRGHGSNDEAR